MLAVLLDDSEVNNLIMTQAIACVPDCASVAYTDPERALEFLEHARPEDVGIAIVDFDMPKMSGIEFTTALRLHPAFQHLPVIMVTSFDQRSLRREALAAGVTDFITKPFDPHEIRARVTNLLCLNKARLVLADRADWLAKEVAAATALIEARERELITLLMKAAECRDTDTGDHIERVAAYVEIMAERLGCSKAECEQMSFASTMHDVGKIGLPDFILLKPGPLGMLERLEMEKHAERGRRILEASSSDLAKLAASIAGEHHEKWDGSGYPRGLKGEEISLAARITAVADVFDALTTARPYKQAWECERAKAYIEANAGTQFDPRCVQAFLRGWPEISRRALKGGAIFGGQGQNVSAAVI